MHGGVAQFVDVFTAMGGLMAERATDLLDIERRTIARLVGEPEPGVAVPSEPSVLVAADLAPADTALLDPSVVVALVTEKGGATSHTAIIARQLGIPCVVGVAHALTLPAGTPVLVDGTSGTIDPTVDAADAQSRVEADRAARAALDSWTGPAETTDGVRVKLLANVADGSSARTAAQAPVEGVGLFRTELCFLDRRDEPDAEEQGQIYGEVLAGVRRLGPVRRRPHPRRRLGQADRLRDPRGRGEPGPRRTRPAAGGLQPRPARAPARRHRSSPPRPPAPRPG